VGEGKRKKNRGGKKRPIASLTLQTPTGVGRKKREGGEGRERGARPGPAPFPVVKLLRKGETSLQGNGGQKRKKGREREKGRGVAPGHVFSQGSDISSVQGEREKKKGRGEGGMGALYLSFSRTNGECLADGRWGGKTKKEGEKVTSPFALPFPIERASCPEKGMAEKKRGGMKEKEKGGGKVRRSVILSLKKKKKKRGGGGSCLSITFAREASHGVKKEGKRRKKKRGEGAALPAGALPPSCKREKIRSWKQR